MHLSYSITLNVCWLAVLRVAAQHVKPPVYPLDLALSTAQSPIYDSTLERQLMRIGDMTWASLLGIKQASPSRELAEMACEVLDRILPGRVYTARDAQYQSEVIESLTWFSLSWLIRSKTAWLQSACIIRPVNTAEVAMAVRVIKVSGIRFAVRSGGHNPNTRFASVDGTGVLLDLKSLDSIALGRDDVLRVGPGQTWERIYHVVQQKGRSVIGGRHGSVGVAGLLLGGGLSFFPSLYGMAVDNVVNFEVVLSDSSIVNANGAENPDLYKALKGGGANFGIVTRFDLETYPRIDAQYTVNAYDGSDYVNILRSTARLQEAMENDNKIGFFLNVVSGVMVAGLLYAEHRSAQPKAFEDFFKLQSLIAPVVPTTNGTVLDLVPILDNVGATVLPARRALNAVSTKVDYELYLRVHERYSKLLKNEYGAGNISYTIQAIPSSVVHAGQRHGSNVLGLNSISQTWWACLMEWSEESATDVAQKQVGGLGDIVRSAAQETNSLLRYTFMNDAGMSQAVMGNYGPENMELLKHAAEKYDPESVFQKQQNAGFLLG
ncbi:FAD-binding domain-containing protein [Xylaria acuta]|nr:FAD-binding domain-containing protein [Xylaria acuta]